MADAPSNNTANPFDVPGAATPISSLSPPNPTTAPAPATFTPPPGPPPSTVAGPPVPDVTTRPAAASPEPAAAAQREREGPTDPRVVSLRALFPDYDDLILQSVLESVGWDQDRAVDALLVMSDPDYRSEQPPAQAQEAPAPVMSQEQLDEQFARQLMIQEQEQQQQQWAAAHPNGPAVYQSSRPQRDQGAWNAAAQQQQGQGAQQQGPPNMGEIQEQFSKFAESGKKTFGNIFSKVKAKIQELDQGRPPSTSGQQQQQNPAWSNSPGISPGAGAASYYGPPQSYGQAAYYDPNPQPTGGIGGSGTGGYTPSPARTPQPQPGPVQGYDVGGSFAPPASSRSPPPTTASTTTTQPQPTTAAASGVLPPPTTNSGPGPGPNPIDAGKFGLLPKRPVSLLRDSTGGAGASATAAGKAPAPAHAVEDDDDDGLEYAENPFEEGKK